MRTKSLALRASESDVSVSRPDGVRGEIAFVFVVQLLTRLRPLILLPVLFGVVGAAAYGRWFVCMSLAALVANLAHGNIHTALIREYGAAGPRRNELVWTTLAAGTAGGFVAGAGLFVLARWISNVIGLAPDSVDLLKGAAGLVVSHVLVDLTTNYYRARGRIQLFTILDALPMFAEVGCVVLAVKHGWSLADAICLIVGLELLLAAACFVPLVRHNSPTLPSWECLKGLIRFSLPTIPFSFGDTLMNQADRAIIAAIAGAAQAGVYTAAYSLSFVPLMVVRPLQTILLVRLSPLWDGGHHVRASKSLRLALKTYLALACPAAIGTAFIGPAVLELLTGRSYSDWTTALLLCLGLGNVLYGACFIVVHALYLLKRTHTAGGVFVLGAALNLMGNLILVPMMGILGAAVMTLAAYGVTFVALMILPRSEFEFTLEPRLLVTLLSSAVLLSGWLTLLGALTPLRLLASVAGGVILHLGLIIGCRTFDESEQQMLLGRQPFAAVGKSA